MKVLYTPGGEYGDCIVKHFDLMDYNDENAKDVLLWGWASLDNNQIRDRYENSDRKIFINTAMPCEIVGGYGNCVATTKEVSITGAFLLGTNHIDFVVCS